MTAYESKFTGLTCSRCDQAHEPEVLQRFCTACKGPLYANYDLDGARDAWRGADFGDRPTGLWRYAELLPVREPRHRLDLGEGGTPLLGVPRLAAELGLEKLLVKDEGPNPTGSFKARGLCMAVSRALELGATTISIPTAGNAGSATAAYCARAGLRAIIYVPAETPGEFMAEYDLLGAEVVVVDGTISDAGAQMARDAEPDWFPVSTLQEPYRLEGKKTMGLELAEQLGWQLPDVIVYPTGGGTGLLGMWKAFDELETMGFVSSARPRMVAVQAEGCAPIVRAFEAGAVGAEPWTDAATMANGLRVPRAFADREILDVLRRSGGEALTVSDRAMIDMVKRTGRLEGILQAPEAAATLVAAQLMRQQGKIAADEQVVCFLTGNAYKYLSSMT